MKDSPGSENRERCPADNLETCHQWFEAPAPGRQRQLPCYTDVMAWIGSNQTRAQAVPSRRVISSTDEAARSFLQRVYLYMSVGLAVTGLVALAVVSSPAALAFVFGNRM